MKKENTDLRTVLIVDDEEHVLSSLKRVLSNEPYNALFASSGKETLEILDTQDVHVLVADLGMPGMDGIELLKIVKERYPHIIRMVISGYTDSETMLAAINEGEILRFIAKPWANKELKIIIQQAIDYYNLCSEREMLIEFFELWIKGTKPGPEDIRFLQELIARQKEHLYKWQKRSGSAAMKP